MQNAIMDHVNVQVIKVFDMIMIHLKEHANILMALAILVAMVRINTD